MSKLDEIKQILESAQPTLFQKSREWQEHFREVESYSKKISDAVKTLKSKSNEKDVWDAIEVIEKSKESLDYNLKKLCHETPLTGPHTTVRG